MNFWKHPRKKDENGVTLIELIVTILIISILASIAVVFFNNQRKSAFDAQVQSDMTSISQQVETFNIKRKPGTLLTALNANDGGLGQYLAENIFLSKGTKYGINGNDSSYCIAAFNPRSERFPSMTTPLYYDSAAGGLQRAGVAATSLVACKNFPVTDVVGESYTYVPSPTTSTASNLTWTAPNTFKFTDNNQGVVLKKVSTGVSSGRAVKSMIITGEYMPTSYPADNVANQTAFGSCYQSCYGYYFGVGYLNSAGTAVKEGSGTYTSNGFASSKDKTVLNTWNPINLQVDSVKDLNTYPAGVPKVYGTFDAVDVYMAGIYGGPNTQYRNIQVKFVLTDIP